MTTTVKTNLTIGATKRMFFGDNKEYSIEPKQGYAPIYCERTLRKTGNTTIDSYKWLLV